MTKNNLNPEDQNEIDDFRKRQSDLINQEEAKFFRKARKKINKPRNRRKKIKKKISKLIKKVFNIGSKLKNTTLKIKSFFSKEQTIYYVYTGTLFFLLNRQLNQIKNQIQKQQQQIEIIRIESRSKYQERIQYKDFIKKNWALCGAFIFQQIYTLYRQQISQYQIQKTVQIQADNLQEKEVECQQLQGKNKEIENQLSKERTEKQKLKETAYETIISKKKLESGIIEQEATIKFLENKIKKFEQNEYSQNSIILKLEDQISNKKYEIDKLKEKELSLTSFNKNIQKELTTQKGIYQSLKYQYQHQKQSVKKLEKKINKLEFNKDKSEDKLLEQFKQFNKELDKQKKIEFKLLKKINNQENKLENLIEKSIVTDQKNKNILKKYKNADKEFQNLLISYNDLSSQLEDESSQNSQLRGKVRVISSLLEDSNKQLEIVKEDQKKIENELQKSEQDYGDYMQSKMKMEKEFEDQINNHKEEIEKNQNELKKMKNSLWQRLIPNIKFDFNIKSKNKQLESKKDDETSLYVNPSFGLFGGGIITKKPSNERRAWYEVKINSNSKKDFLEEVSSH